MKRHHSDVTVILIGCLLLSVLSSCASDEKLFNISGIVRDEKGAPITDAWVRAKDLDKGIARTVLTNGGKYIIPGLWSGNYRIDSWKWGLDRIEKPLGNVSRDQTVDLTLKASTQPITGWDLTEYDWLMILPGGKSAGDKTSDKMFFTWPAMQVAMDKDGNTRGFPQRVIDYAKGWNHKTVPHVWENIMAQIDGGHFMYDPKLTTHFPGWREAIIRYMKTAFDPDKVDNYKLRKFPLPLTEETREAVFTVYDIPTPDSHPHSVAVDSQGNCWFTAIHSGAIGKVDSKTGKVTEYKIPLRSDRKDPKYTDQDFYYVFRSGRYGGQFADVPMPHGPSVDADDNVWTSMLNVSAIVKFEPKTETFKFYETPNWNQFSAFSAVDYKRGRVWVGGDFFGNGGHMVDIATGEVKTFVLPTEGVVPYGSNIDKNGNFYLGGINEGSLYRIDANTFKITKYSPPTRFSGIHRMCGDSKGRMWLSLSASMKLGMWDPKTEKITEHDLPTEMDILMDVWPTRMTIFGSATFLAI